MNKYLSIREYLMIYRGPGFLAVVWFGSTPIPYPPLPSTICLFFSVFLCFADRAYCRERWGAFWTKTNLGLLTRLFAIFQWFNYYFFLPTWLCVIFQRKHKHSDFTLQICRGISHENLFLLMYLTMKNWWKLFFSSHLAVRISFFLRMGSMTSTFPPTEHVVKY